MNDPQSQRRVAVIGGGITGLAAAHRILELDPSIDVALLEASDRLGGVIQTEHRDGYLVERGPDNFITNVPWAIDLCRRIGFDDQLVETNSNNRGAFVVHRGNLHKIPEGFLIMAPSRIWPVLSTPILSWLGKLRLASEYFVAKNQTDKEESLAEFATRRLGREVYERLVQPLVGGIYTADPKSLSLKATLPRFIDMEQEHGSLIRAAWRQVAKQSSNDRTSSGARYSLFTAPQDGLSSLVEALASKLPEGAIRLNSPVERIQQGDAGMWSLETSNAQTIEVDTVIVTTPAHRSADLVSGVDDILAAKLRKIPHAPCAIVSLGFRREQIGHPLDGFGFVVPFVEKRKILSASFSSVKYANRAPDDCELIRVFIGGATQPELVDLPEDELVTIAVRELGDLLRLKGEPIFTLTSRWRKVMPQYHLGHCELIDEIQTRVGGLPGIYLAGNAYQGVGIPHCIHSGERVASEAISENIH